VPNSQVVVPQRPHFLTFVAGIGPDTGRLEPGPRQPRSGKASKGCHTSRHRESCQSSSNSANSRRAAPRSYMEIAFYNADLNQALVDN